MADTRRKHDRDFKLKAVELSYQKDNIAYRTPVYNDINLIEEYRLHLTLLNS